MPVRYRDEHLAIVAKPAGVVTHPDREHRRGTLVNRLLGMGVPLAPAGGPLRPGIVHRLDAGTSGLMLVASTDEAFAALRAMFKRHEVERRYLALVRGRARARGVRASRRRSVGAPPGSSSTAWRGGRRPPAFEVRERLPRTTLLEAAPGPAARTRSACICRRSATRSWATALRRGRRRGPRLGLHRPFLHSWRLAFAHPITGERSTRRSRCRRTSRTRSARPRRPAPLTPRWPGVASGSTESHACKLSTARAPCGNRGTARGLPEGLDEGAGRSAMTEPASFTCTCTRSTRCWTGRRGSRRRSPTPPRPTIFTEALRPRHARAGHDRSRRDVRHAEVLRGRAGRRRQADHRRRGLRRARLAVRSQPRARARRSTTTSPCSRGRDRLPQPAEARLGRPTSRASTTGRGWTSSSWPSTPRASSASRAACPRRSASSCSPASTTARARPPPSTATSSAPTATSSRCRTTGSPTSGRSCAKQVELAREIGVPVVATNDLHYTRPDDAKPHDVLLCIQQQKLQSDPKRLKFDSEDFYLKSARRDARVFAELPEACDNTLDDRRARASSPELERRASSRRHRYHLPRFETPAGETARQLPARAGRARARRPLRRPDPAEVTERIDHELVDHLEDGVRRATS